MWAVLKYIKTDSDNPMRSFKTEILDWQEM